MHASTIRRAELCQEKTFAMQKQHYNKTSVCYQANSRPSGIKCCGPMIQRWSCLAIVTVNMFVTNQRQHFIRTPIPTVKRGGGNAVVWGWFWTEKHGQLAVEGFWNWQFRQGNLQTPYNRLNFEWGSGWRCLQELHSTKRGQYQLLRSRALLLFPQNFITSIVIFLVFLFIYITFVCSHWLNE